MIKKIKNLFHGISLAYGARFGVEMALFEASKKDYEDLDDFERDDIVNFICISMTLYKKAVKLCPKFIVNMIVRHNVGKP